MVADKEAFAPVAVLANDLFQLVRPLLTRAARMWSMRGAVGRVAQRESTTLTS